MMVEIAFAYEGTVDKFVGDMIMVVWGAPVAHADDPRRAVQAALDMQAALERYNAARERPIRIGIGINTDQLVAGYIGSTRTMSYSVIGDAVNIASRLCSAAGPGQILISENTYRKLHRHFDTIELDPVKAKGKSSQSRFSACSVRSGSHIRLLSNSYLGLNFDPYTLRMRV